MMPVVIGQERDFGEFKWQSRVVANSPRGGAGKLGGEKSWRWRGGEIPSGAEEVVERHFGLDCPTIFVTREACCRDHREMHALARSGDLGEDAHLRLQLAVSLLVDGIGARRPFHLADVDDPVRPIQQEVNLRTLRVNLIRNMPTLVSALS